MASEKLYRASEKLYRNTLIREASEQGPHSGRHIYGTKYSLANRHWRSPFQIWT